jgi:hypothetical protein
MKAPGWERWAPELQEVLGLDATPRFWRRGAYEPRDYLVLTHDDFAELLDWVGQELLDQAPALSREQLDPIRTVIRWRR